MADAPEVVPSPLSPDSTNSNVQRFQTPTSSPQNEKRNPHDPGARAIHLAYGDEKQALSNDEEAPKTALNQHPETEETNPKIGYAHDDRAGSGMETAPRTALISDARMRRQDVQERERGAGQSDWHFGFWESFKPSSLCQCRE